MTTHRPRLHLRPAVHALLAVGVAVALLVYGVTGVFVQMLGASHFHRGVAGASGFVPLDDFRRQSPAALGHAHGVFGHTLSSALSSAASAVRSSAHSFVSRHLHDAADPAWVTVGADDAADEVASSGAACQLALLPADVTCGAPGAASVRWPSLRTTFAFLDLDRIERPPRG